MLAEVPQNKAELVSESAVKSGSFGGTVLRGKGISSSGLADALGLGAKTKDIVLIRVEQENKEKIFSIFFLFFQQFIGFFYMFSKKCQ